VTIGSSTMDKKLGKVLEEAEKVSDEVDLGIAVANPVSREESLKFDMTSSTISEADTVKETSQQPKKRSWKKPKDKPKRPLSAYNLFFQQERERILASLPPLQNAPGSGVSIGRRDRRRHGKIGFADLARTIAERWKGLDESSRSFFEAQAAIEKEHYKHQVAVWRWKREAAAQGANSQALSPAFLEALTAATAAAQTTAPVASSRPTALNASLQQAALLHQAQASYMMTGQQTPVWAQQQSAYYRAPSPAAVIQQRQYDPRGFAEAEPPAPLYQQPTTGPMGLSLPQHHQPFAGPVEAENSSKQPAVPLGAAGIDRLQSEGQNSSSSSSIVSLSDIEGLDNLGVIDGAFGEEDSLSGRSTPRGNSNVAVLDPEEVAAMLREFLEED
jgi:hypothetical protein